MNDAQYVLGQYKFLAIYFIIIIQTYEECTTV